MENFMQVLFCTVPITSLFNIKYYAEPNLGGTEITGALKSEGVDVIHLDLNAALNEYRFKNENFSNQILEQEDFNVLVSKEHLKKFLEDPTESLYIDRWATYLSKYINSFLNEQSIDALCFSVSKIMNEYYTSIGGFNISIILRKYLNYIDSSIPFYMGGKYVMTMLKQKKYIDDIEDYVPTSLLPTYYITGEAHLVFHNFLLENLKQDRDYIKQRNAGLVDSKVRIKPLNKYGDATYVPDLKPLNFKSAELDVSTGFFPKEMLSHFPELGQIKPFNYYNYRFTGGCIFKCSYCTSGIESDKMWRKDSPIQVADCLESFYDSGVKYIRFFNNNINFKISWLKEFCNEIVKRNLDIKWSDSANLKVGDRDMFLAMGEAGCIKLWYGTETVSPRILKEIRKDVPPERIDAVLNWSHEAGIWNCSNLLLNFPHETNEEYEMVRNFIKKYYDSGILNGFQATILKLLHDTEMGHDPDRFRITLQEDHHVARKLIYTENNNAGWEEIHDRGEYRLRHLGDLVNIFDSKFLPIFENDYFFFSMYEAYGKNKMIKKQIYTHLINNEKMYEDFIDKNLSVYMYEGYLYKKMFSKVLNERTNNSITTRA